MRGQHVEFYDNAAPEAGIVAGDVESGEEVAEDARHGLQLVGRDGVAVDRARGLARQPLVDARRAEGMFTLRRLKNNNKENLSNERLNKRTTVRQEEGMFTLRRLQRKSKKISIKWTPQ